MRGIQRSLWAGALIVTGILAGTGCQQPKVERVGWVIGIKKEAIPEYKRMHANAWPEVIRLLKETHIQNYSIYIAEVEPDKYYLFSYLEYTGKDFNGDLAKLKDHKAMQDWLKLTDPMQNPIPLRKQGEWWMRMDEIFRVE